METDGKKKRKLDPPDEDPRHQPRREVVVVDEEEDEEKKIEEFYALIRSTREVRERLIRRGGEGERKKRGDTNANNIGSQGLVWNPKFRLEDFQDSHVIGTRSARDDRGRGDVASPSRNVGKPLMVVLEDEEEEKEKKDDKEEIKGKAKEIDLNLSL